MAGKKRPLVIPKADVSGHAVDCEALPDATKEDLSRVIFRQVREFFSDPAVKADYDKWLVEYRQTHPLAKGGAT